MDKAWRKEYALGEQIAPLAPESAVQARLHLVLTNETGLQEYLAAASWVPEEEPNLGSVKMCRVESFPDLYVGMFAVPRQIDVVGMRRKILLYVTEDTVLLCGEDDFVVRLVENIRRRRRRQGSTMERFLYNFFSELLIRGTYLLNECETEVMSLEDKVQSSNIDDLPEQLAPLRQKLLTLRSYFDQLSEMASDFSDNENDLFESDDVDLFRTVSDRAGHLMDRTSFLLECALQVKDSYQTRIADEQNDNMQFLTIISTIFFPLTLITGWYGMNFNNMPELNGGYPVIIAVSVLVVLGCLFIFKKKHLL